MLTQSRKHNLRHTKPFHCTVEGCKRVDGFSTSNDLERHVKSLHLNKTGDAKLYKCLVSSCKSKDKLWPRLDNFKSHLKRKHDLNLEETEDIVRR